MGKFIFALLLCRILWSNFYFKFVSLLSLKSSWHDPWLDAWKWDAGVSFLLGSSLRALTHHSWCAPVLVSVMMGLWHTKRELWDSIFSLFTDSRSTLASAGIKLQCHRQAFCQPCSLLSSTCTMVVETVIISLKNKNRKPHLIKNKYCCWVILPPITQPEQLLFFPLRV